MNKCFITRLESSIQGNNDLPYFGEVYLSIKGDRTNKNACIRINTGSDKIQLFSDGNNLSFTNISEDLVNKLTVPPNSTKTVYFGGNEETYKVRLVSKYAKNVSIKNITSVPYKISINIDDLKYTLFKEIYLWGFPLTGNISSIATMSNLTSFYSIYGSLEGDISSLKEKRNLISFGTDSKKVTGDISNLSNNIGLTTLCLLNSSITGKIESLIEPLFKGGANGTLNITGNYYVTLNNVVVGNNIMIKVTFSNQGCTVSKNDTIIATFNNDEWQYLS